ncbi:hypothetical protein HYV98_01410 [Candidatus Azambacteria bacterium]|nr:hypothetical protein [Candidatus Azambacteria bacterium]
MKPSPQTTAPLPQAPEAAPVAFFTREPEKTVTLTLLKKDRPTLLNLLAEETKTPGVPGTITRILVKAGGSFLQTRDFLELLGVDPAPGFLRILAPNFVLFTAPEGVNSPSRLGVVLQTTNREAAKEALLSWEPSLDRDWTGLFLNLPISRPPEAAFQTELFEFLPVHRLLLPTPDISVNYAFFDTYLILTTSQKSIENAIRHIPCAG